MAYMVENIKADRIAVLCTLHIDSAKLLRPVARAGRAMIVYHLVALPGIRDSRVRIASQGGGLFVYIQSTAVYKGRHVEKTMVAWCCDRTHFKDFIPEV